MKRDPLYALNLIAQTLYSKKGYNILALDVRGISTLTDYFLIAEGNVNRHVIALGEAVVERMRLNKETPLHLEGLDAGDWVVIDFQEIIVHLFVPGMRDKYRLEELWQKGKIVDLELEKVVRYG